MTQVDGIKKFFGKFSRKNRLPAMPAALGSRSQKWSIQQLRNYTFFYQAIVIVMCAYFVADFFAVALLPFIPEAKAPKPMLSYHPPKNIAQYNPIFMRNLFNEKGLIPETDEFSDDSPPIKTTLPLNLLGVIVLKDELKSVASVEDRGANQVSAVRVNDYITPEALVQKIETSKVIFFNRTSGRREFIDLPQENSPALTRRTSAGPGIQKTNDSHFNIDRTEVDKTLTNINQVLTEARCVPNIEGGRPAGYRCFQIVPGSIYDKLGLKNDDVICGINGEAINDPGKAFEVFSALKNMNSIELCINRGGQISNVTYDIH
jgi:general secretion pathway protein C